MTSIKKIDLADCTDSIFLVCSFDNSKQLHITVLDNEKCKAFSGHATDIELRSQAATLRMTFSEFITLTLKALTSKSEVDAIKFLYCLEQNCKSFLFRWKSIDQDETIINIGCITVTEQDYKSVTNSTFSMLSAELSGLNEEIENKKQTISKLNKEKEEHLRLVTDMSDMKERLETELYSKFILVLNEKKRKIKALKENGSDTLPNNVRKIIKPVLPKKTHLISDSSDEEICDQEIRNIPGPSNTKHNASLMFFDDEEPPVSTSPSKKRTRHKTIETKAFEVKRTRAPSPVTMDDSEDEDELFKCL